MEVIGETSFNDKDGMAVLCEPGDTVLCLTANGHSLMVTPPSDNGLSPQEQVMRILCEKLLDGDFIRKFIKEYGTKEQQIKVN